MVVERESRYFAAYRVGDTVSYMGRDFTVSGVVVNPLMFSEEEEPSLTDADTYIDAVFYFDSALSFMPVTSDLYVRVESAHGHKLFSKNTTPPLRTHKKSLPRRWATLRKTSCFSRCAKISAPRCTRNTRRRFTT